MKLAPFCLNHWLILIFKSDQNLSIITALQPWVMVVKDIFPFATITDGFKKVTFMELFHKIQFFFVKNFQKVMPKMPFSWEKPMKIASSQPSVMVAKYIFRFAIVTDGCKEANFKKFSHLFMKMSWLLKACIYLWIWQKRSKFTSHSSK